MTGWAAVLSGVFAAGRAVTVTLLPSGQRAGTAERVLPALVALLSYGDRPGGARIGRAGAVS